MVSIGKLSYDMFYLVAGLGAICRVKKHILLNCAESIHHRKDPFLRDCKRVYWNHFG